MPTDTERLDWWERAVREGREPSVTYYPKTKSDDDSFEIYVGDPPAYGEGHTFRDALDATVAVENGSSNK